MFQHFIHNPAAISITSVFVLGVIGLIFSKNKLRDIGKRISAWGNKTFGAKAEEMIEEKLQDIVDGMKSDNEVKK